MIYALAVPRAAPEKRLVAPLRLGCRWRSKRKGRAGRLRHVGRHRRFREHMCDPPAQVGGDYAACIVRPSGGRIARGKSGGLYTCGTKRWEDPWIRPFGVERLYPGEPDAHRGVRMLAPTGARAGAGGSGGIGRGCTGGSICPSSMLA